MSEAKKAQGALVEAFGGTQEEAAELLGVSTRTLRRWRDDRNYQEEVRRLRELASDEANLILIEATRRLALSQLRALEALNEALGATYQDGNPNHITRIRAAQELRQWGESLELNDG